MDLINKMIVKENVNAEQKIINKQFIENLVNTKGVRTAFKNYKDECFSFDVVKTIPNTDLLMFKNRVYLKDGTRIGDIVGNIEEVLPIKELAKNNCDTFVLKRKESVKLKAQYLRSITRLTWKRMNVFYVFNNKGENLTSAKYTRIFVDKDYVSNNTYITLLDINGDDGILLKYNEKFACAQTEIKVQSKDADNLIV